MIWIRRVLTFPLGILLTISILIGLGFSGSIDTFLNPDLVSTELEDSDVYVFLLQDVLDSALKDLRSGHSDKTDYSFLQKIVVDSGLSDQELIIFINHILPSMYVQKQTEHVLGQIGPYAVGETNTFQINIQMAEQAEMLISEIGPLFRKSNGYELIIDGLVQEVFSNQSILISGRVDERRISNLLKKVFPDLWVYGQIDQVLINATPFLMGETDRFNGEIVLKDRARILMAELKILLAESDAYSLIYDRMIEPEIHKLVPKGLELPLGFTITTDEILEALRRVATPEWIRLETEKLIDESHSYFSMEVDSLKFMLSIHDNKSDAEGVITEIVNNKIKDAINSAPDCTPSQLVLFELSQLDSIPQCLPRMLDRQVVIDKLSSQMEPLVRYFISVSVPDELIITETDVRHLFNTGSDDGTSVTSETIKNLQRIITNGWKYDENTAQELIIGFLGEYRGKTNHQGQIRLPSSFNLAQFWFKAKNSAGQSLSWISIPGLDAPGQYDGKLRLKVDHDYEDHDSVFVTFYDDDETVLEEAEIWIYNSQFLDLLKLLISDGWDYKETEFKGDLQSAAVPGLERKFNIARKYLGLSMKYESLLYVPILILAVLIGLLGGRSWKGRLRWTSSYLIVISATVYLSLGPMNHPLLEIYDKFVGNALTGVKSNMWDHAYQHNSFYQTQSLVLDKILEVVQSMTQKFIQEVAKKSLFLILLSCLCFGMSFLPYRKKSFI